jgi:hypothetical protein
MAADSIAVIAATAIEMNTFMVFILCVYQRMPRAELG